MPVSSPMLDRAADKFTLDPDGCWRWRASKDRGGYGTFQHEGRVQGAHRVIYTALRGPIPDGLQVDHLCRVRHCVNPDHMELVTADENKRRAVHDKPDRCVNGHPYTSENTRHSAKRRHCRTCQRSVDARCRAKKREAMQAARERES